MTANTAGNGCVPALCRRGYARMWAELVLIRQVQSSFPTGDGKLASRMESLDNSPGKNSWKRQERGPEKHH